MSNLLLVLALSAAASARAQPPAVVPPDPPPLERRRSEVAERLRSLEWLLARQPSPALARRYAALTESIANAGDDAALETLGSSVRAFRVSALSGAGLLGLPPGRIEEIERGQNEAIARMRARRIDGAVVSRRRPQEGQNVDFEALAGDSAARARYRLPLAVADFHGITSDYNPTRMHPVLNISRPHPALDMRAMDGEAALAAAGGRVVFAGRDGIHGNRVIIDHGDGNFTSYSHLASIPRYLRRFADREGFLRAPIRVEEGQELGATGATGRVGGPHLHFETFTQLGRVRFGDRIVPVASGHIDPRRLLPPVPPEGVTW
ncbi:MAG: M23 family metallopeptidase [Proteobacteria bacterium]|nr:M23 family metallopeptidase [Pseudomonadota bacterium]